MPVFVYVCCGTTLEQIEGGALAEHQNYPPTCRKCGRVMTRQLLDPKMSFNHNKAFESMWPRYDWDDLIADEEIFNK